MPLTESEISEVLSERQLADTVLDRWGQLRTYYQHWQDDYATILRIYRGNWTMIWPDGRSETVDPSVPNMVRVAAEDRAKSVAATAPTVICYPDGPGDDARHKADKLERIVNSWLSMNRVKGYTTQMWAHDALAGGLTVCKVMPDFSKAEMFPKFTRLAPQLCYPDPVFAPGPFVDSMCYAYEAKRRTVEKRYGVKLEWPREKAAVSDENVKVIEYHDDTYSQVVVEQVLTTNYTSQKPKRQMLVNEKHMMGTCPVVIGVRPTMDGTYSGAFDGGLGVLNYWNKLMTLVMDDAVRKVYPERITYNVLNPQDYGPDAQIELETPDARYEYVNQGNQPFSNLQVLRDLNNSVRSSFLVSASRSGDPNESIISAAGVNAVDGQRVEDVRSIQRDIIAPMLTAAIQVALAGEEAWTPDVTKAVYGAKGGYRETYKPSKDIAGYRSAEIRYGSASGLDEINQNVMVLQQLGANIIDKRTAMEMSPFVEDPQRVEKRQLQEVLQGAMLAGLAQQAQQGAIDSFTLATISQAVESDEVSLSEAIAALVPQAPLAPPQPTSPGAPPEAPGIAGAAEGPQMSNMPPLAELLGG